MALITQVDADLVDLVLDPLRLKQVLYNYISNAIRFTPADGRVTVRAGAEGAEHFRVEVEDTGIGISAADQARLFVQFQQLEGGRNKRHQGTGLGLALTRRLVEAQGGAPLGCAAPLARAVRFTLYSGAIRAWSPCDRQAIRRAVWLGSLLRRSRNDSTAIVLAAQAIPVSPYSCVSAVGKPERTRPDLVFMDTSLPGPVNADTTEPFGCVLTQGGTLAVDDTGEPGRRCHRHGPARMCRAHQRGCARMTTMTNLIDAFIVSLDGQEPPPFATPMLRAIWHGLRGDWEHAHELAQVQDDAEGAWVHAWLHRIEGDAGNAAYWYQRAGKQPGRDATRDEGLAIARTLIGSMPRAARQLPGHGRTSWGVLFSR